MEKKEVKILIAEEQHTKFAAEICTMIEEAARIRGTGIAKRSPEYIEKKIREGKAVVAVDGDSIVGFSYIETWEHKKFVANSGLIVHPEYRGLSLASQIKKKILELSKTLYPDAKVFGITTSNAVLNINFKLGYRPVTFSELTTDPAFWAGCKGCVNYDILERTNHKMCLCTGMIYEHGKKNSANEHIAELHNEIEN